MKEKIFLAVFCLLFISTLSYAGFMDLGVGGRPLGMGHAFVGLADDVNAIYYNPAGLINVRKTELTFMYAPLFVGLTDGSNIADYYGAYAQKLDAKSAIGGGWLGRYLLGPGYTQGEMLYQENMFYVSYARKLMDKLTVGASLKIPQHQYGEDQYTKTGVDDNGVVNKGVDPTFANGYGKMGVSIDAGLLYALAKNITVGVMLQDLYSTNLALSSTENDTTADQIPLNFKAGVAYKIPKLAAIEDLAIAADFAYRLGRLRNDWKLHVGAEMWFLVKSIAVRGGFGYGGNSYTDLALGGSYVFLGVPDIELDYAWVYPLSGIKSSGNHRVSCVIHLGMKAEEEARLKAGEEAKKKAEEETRLKAGEEAKLKAGEAKRKADEETRKVELEKLKAETEKLKAEAEKLKAEAAEAQKAKPEAEAKVSELKGKLETLMKEMPKEVSMKETTRGLAVSLGSSVFFATGKASLTPTAYPLLDKIVEVVNAYPDNKISIEGHTDSVGKRSANLSLSAERTDNVANYFVAKGVARERISVKGYGPDRPVASNDTVSGREQNRRVEVIILK